MKEIDCCRYSLIRVGGFLLLVALSGISIGTRVHMNMFGEQLARLSGLV
jgi:hypothetical protein